MEFGILYILYMIQYHCRIVDVTITCHSLFECFLSEGLEVCMVLRHQEYCFRCVLCVSPKTLKFSLHTFAEMKTDESVLKAILMGKF